MAVQVTTDLSYGIWPHLAAVLLGKVCSWPVLNLSHEADSCPAELGLQATVTIPHYTSGNKQQMCTSHNNKIDFESFFSQYHSLFPHTF